MPEERRASDLAGWRRLYEATALYQQSQPWETLTDADIFAVQPLGAEDISYCSILGNAGIEYGLAAYRGASGLLAHVMMMDDALDRDEAFLLMDCLALSLGPREFMDKGDRQIMSALSLKFRGSLAWPLYRSYRPNLLAAHLQARESALLATCLEQGIALAKEVQDGRPLPSSDDSLPLRREDASGRWETSFIPFPALQIMIPPVSEELLSMSMDQLPISDAQWEARLLAVAPIGTAGDDGFWGRTLMCVDHSSGFVLGVRILNEDDSVPEALLETILATSLVPSVLLLTSEWLQVQLEPVTAELGIEVQLVERLPMLEEASDSLLAALRR